MQTSEINSELSYAYYVRKNAQWTFTKPTKESICQNNYIRSARRTEHAFYIKNTGKEISDSFDLEEGGEVSFSSIMMPDFTRTKIIGMLSSLPVGKTRTLRYVIPSDRGGKWINIYFNQETVGAVSLVDLDEILKEQKEIGFYTVKGDVLLSTLKLHKKTTDADDIHMSVESSTV